MSRISSLVVAGMLTAAVAACGGSNNASPSSATGTATGAGSSTLATLRPSLSAGSSTSASISSSPKASLSSPNGASAQPSASPSTGASLSTSPGESLSGTQITVTAVDYQFTGMPVSVPAGTTLTLQNIGTEVHEMIVVMKNPGVTQSWDELLAMPQDQSAQYVTIVGDTVAPPLGIGDSSIQVTQEGDYLMLCMIPQGTYSLPPSMEPGASGEPGASAEPGASTVTSGPTSSPEATVTTPIVASPGASGLESPSASMGIPHYMLGMQQEFQVTAAGSSPGPIPTAAPSMEPGSSGEPAASTGTEASAEPSSSAAAK